MHICDLFFPLDRNLSKRHLLCITPCITAVEKQFTTFKCKVAVTFSRQFGWCATKKHSPPSHLKVCVTTAVIKQKTFLQTNCTLFLKLQCVQSSGCFWLSYCIILVAIVCVWNSSQPPVSHFSTASLSAQQACRVTSFSVSDVNSIQCPHQKL